MFSVRALSFLSSNVILGKLLYLSCSRFKLEEKSYFVYLCILQPFDFHSCPQQLNRWPCPLVRLLPLTIRLFTTLQSDPRDLWPLRHVIRVMRGHYLAKTRQWQRQWQMQRQRQWQMTKTNTRRELLQEEGASLDQQKDTVKDKDKLVTCDIWDSN